MIGRPPKSRIISSGPKLRKALEIWGKSWGRADLSNNHVTQWDRWLEHSLPLSATTIRNDIQSGIPVERLDNYSKCLNISKNILLDENISAKSKSFRATLLNCCREDTTEQHLNHIFPAPLQAAYFKFNHLAILNELFDIISGVYEGFWIEGENGQEVLKLALTIDSVKNGYINARAMYMYYGVEHHVELIVFRWNTNMHFLYTSDDYTSLSHILFLDPLSFRKVKYNKELILKGKQLSDSGDLDAQPTASNVYLKKVNTEYHTTVSELRKKPAFDESDPNFSNIKKTILTPTDV